MHIGKAFKRNQIELGLFAAGLAILIAQIIIAKHDLSQGGIDHTLVFGASFDDTYIHARYAENLFHRLGYSFNPGHILSADTSPFWVVLLSISGFFTSHFDLVAMLFSAIAWLLIAPGVYRIARYVFVWERSYSLAAAICILLSPRLLALALSGMETAFATLLSLIAIEMHYRSREIKQIRIREAIVLSLGIALRPEFALLAILAMTDWIFCAIKKDIRWKNMLSFLILLAFLSHFVFALPMHERGSLLYHSSLVQGAGFHFPPDLYYIGRSFYILLENFWWVVILLLFYIVSFRLPKIKGSNIVIVLFVILLPVVQGFIAPQYRHFGRYVFPLLPLVALSVIALLRRNMRGYTGAWANKSIIYLPAIAAICSLPLALKWTKVYSQGVRNINDQHLAAAEWVQENTGVHDKIAAHDVGALGYFTKRDIIDLTGLTSPEFYPLQKNQSLVWKEARRQGANIFIIYTRLNPTFYQYAKDSLELVKELRVREPLVVSADTVMTILKVKGS